jgi:hypothetical protein
MMVRDLVVVAVAEINGKIKDEIVVRNAKRRKAVRRSNAILYTRTFRLRTYHTYQRSLRKTRPNPKCWQCKVLSILIQVSLV